MPVLPHQIYPNLIRFLFTNRQIRPTMATLSCELRRDEHEIPQAYLFNRTHYVRFFLW